MQPDAWALGQEWMMGQAGPWHADEADPDLAAEQAADWHYAEWAAEDGDVAAYMEGMNSGDEEAAWDDGAGGLESEGIDPDADGAVYYPGEMDGLSTDTGTDSHTDSHTHSHTDSDAHTHMRPDTHTHTGINSTGGGFEGGGSGSVAGAHSGGEGHVGHVGQEGTDSEVGWGAWGERGESPVFWRPEGFARRCDSEHNASCDTSEHEAASS